MAQAKNSSTPRGWGGPASHGNNPRPGGCGNSRVMVAACNCLTILGLLCGPFQTYSAG